MGRQICRVALCRIHGLGMRTLTRVLGRVRNGQVVAMPTKRGGSYQRDRAKEVYRFIEHLAQTEGYPDPSGRGSKRDKPVIYLKAGWTKKWVYTSRYLPLMDALNIEAVSYKYFTHSWAKGANRIRIRKPKTDICDTCDFFRKNRDVPSVLLHLDRAKVQREAFKLWILQSRTPDSVSVV